MKFEKCTSGEDSHNWLSYSSFITVQNFEIYERTTPFAIFYKVPYTKESHDTKNKWQQVQGPSQTGTKSYSILVSHLAGKKKPLQVANFSAVHRTANQTWPQADTLSLSGKDKEEKIQ